MHHKAFGAPPKPAERAHSARTRCAIQAVSLTSSKVVRSFLLPRGKKKISSSDQGNNEKEQRDRQTDRQRSRCSRCFRESQFTNVHGKHWKVKLKFKCLVSLAFGIGKCKGTRYEHWVWTGVDPVSRQSVRRWQVINPSRRSLAFGKLASFMACYHRRFPITESKDWYWTRLLYLFNCSFSKLFCNLSCYIFLLIIFIVYVYFCVAFCCNNTYKQK